MAVAGHIIHVSQELIPCHHSRCLVGGVSVSWACALLGVSAKLLAHVDANVMEFVLNCDAVLQIFRHACLADLCNAHCPCLALQRCHAPPTLDGRMSIAGNIVHVLEQLVPSHDTRSLVGGVCVAWASA